MNIALMETYWPLAGILVLAVVFVGVAVLRRANGPSSSRRLAFALTQGTISTIAIFLLVLYLFWAKSYLAALAVTILWLLIIAGALIGIIALLRRRKDRLHSH